MLLKPTTKPNKRLTPSPRMACTGGHAIYRWVNEGEGSIYHFNPGKTPYLGTFDCQTCVGVFFALEDGSFFCAHINPHVNITKDWWVHDVQNGEGGAIKQSVISLLRSQCGSPYSLKDKRNVVVVCPRLYENKYGEKDSAKWKKKVGWYVVEGIRAWLAEDTANTKKFDCDEQSQGFVVNTQSGEVFKIPVNNSIGEVTGGLNLKGDGGGKCFFMPVDDHEAGQRWAPSADRKDRELDPKTEVIIKADRKRGRKSERQTGR